MKALHILSALSLLCSHLLLAEQTNEKLEEYLSENKKQQFSYDYEKNEAESSKLRDAWIAPLNLNYNYTVSEPYGKEQTSQSAAIRMDQPIFQSGGIYFGIKFAQASKIYSDYSVDVAKRKLTKDAISLLMQIKQTTLKIDKQNLLIKNAEINLELKKEQYLNGQLDSGFLDNAILEKNSVTQTLFDIQTNKERLISKFNAISDMSYEKAEIPHLKILNKEQFLGDNLVVNRANSEIEKNRHFKNITTTKYLPRVSVTAGYNYLKNENQVVSENELIPQNSSERNYYDYGLKASMPLDINSFVDIESSKVDYLKSKAVIEDTKRELTALFEQVMQNIENFEKKRALSVSNRDIYEKLLTDTKELFSAGYKTEFDVALLENSFVVQGLDLGIYEIDKQLELLTLYEMYQDATY